MKRYWDLRRALFEADMPQAELAKPLGRSPGYVDVRMAGRASWTMADAYTICDVLHIPREEIYKYFPPDGIAPKESAPCGR